MDLYVYILLPTAGNSKWFLCSGLRFSLSDKFSLAEIYRSLFFRSGPGRGNIGIPVRSLGEVLAADFYSLPFSNGIRILEAVENNSYSFPFLSE
jgi:hypothetical protein